MRLPTHKHVSTWVTGIVLAVVGCAAFLNALDNPALTFSVLAFLILLSPTSSFVPIRTEMGAERRMYLPLIPLVGLSVVSVGTAIQRFGATRPELRRVLSVTGICCGLLILTACVWRTRERNHEFSDTLRLWEGAYAIDPENSRLLSNLAATWALRGNQARAEELTKRAAELDPQNAIAWHNLAVVLEEQGRLKEAEAVVLQILQRQPEQLDALLVLQRIRWKQVDIPNAEELARRIIERHPASTAGWLAYSRCRAAQGDYPDAFQAAERARRLDAKSPEVCLALAFPLRQMGEFAAAAAAIQQVLKSDEKSAAGWHEMGLLLSDLNRQEEAINAFRNACEFDPSNADALNNLGVLLTRRTPAEAVPVLERATQLAPKSDRAFNSLGNAYTQCGRYPEAIAAYRRALEINPENSTAAENLKIVLGQFSQSAKP